MSTPTHLTHHNEAPCNSLQVSGMANCNPPTESGQPLLATTSVYCEAHQCVRAPTNLKQLLVQPALRPCATGSARQQHHSASTTHINRLLPALINHSAVPLGHDKCKKEKRKKFVLLKVSPFSAPIALLQQTCKQLARVAHRKKTFSPLKLWCSLGQGGTECSRMGK